MSRRKERWKEKQRQHVKEKMDNSVRAAQIYDELTRMNEARINGEHYHSSSSSSRVSSKEKRIERLKSCVVFPLVFALIICVAASLLVGVIALIKIDWVKENISFKKPTFAVYQEPEALQISSDKTQGTISLSSIDAPRFNENFAKIQCDKLGEMEISVFYRGNYDALKIGAVLENEGSYPGYGRSVIYAYHTTYFKHLSSITEGDKINVTTSYGNFVYKVYKTGVEKKRYSFDAADESTIVLYTDEFEGITGSNSQRFIYVYASLVSGPTVMK